MNMKLFARVRSRDVVVTWLWAQAERGAGGGGGARDGAGRGAGPGHVRAHQALRARAGRLRARLPPAAPRHRAGAPEGYIRIDGA